MRSGSLMLHSVMKNNKTKTQLGTEQKTSLVYWGQVYHPDDEGSWFNEHNRLVLDGEMQANMNLMADAPIILEAYKRLREGY